MKGGDLTGELLANRYEVREPIGAGGMATVHLGVDTRLDRKVVVKVPREPLLRTDPTFRTRFSRELNRLTQLAHPNIVRVLDAGELDGLPWVVMEYLGGGSLEERLADTGGSQCIEEILAWLGPVAAALDYIHESNVLHRDVKPGNILFDERGEPYLADFGLAKALHSSEDSLTMTGVAAGSPGYIPPEIMGRNFTPAYDQYSLGAVVFRALTHGLPDFGVKEDAVRAALADCAPAVVRDALVRALAHDPADRFPRCADLVAALRDVSTPIPEPPTGLDAAPVRRRRWHVVGLLALGLLAVGGFLLFDRTAGDRGRKDRADAPAKPPATGREDAGKLESGKIPHSREGDEFLDGRVVLAAIESLPGVGGRWTFVLENRGEEDLEAVSVTAVFYSPSQGIEQFRTTAVRQTVNLVAGRAATVVVEAPAAGVPLGCKLRLEEGGEITVAREGETRGTFWLRGRLECVGIRDDRFGTKPAIELTVENVGMDVLEGLLYRLRFLKPETPPVETAWTRMPGKLGPGETRVLHPLLPSEETGMASLVLQIRRARPSEYFWVTEADPDARLDERAIERLPRVLEPGNRLVGPLVLETPFGGRVELGKQGVLYIPEPDDGVFHLALRQGTARCTLEDRLEIAVAFGRVSTRRGRKSECFIEAGAESRGAVRSLSGQTILALRLVHDRLDLVLEPSQGCEFAGFPRGLELTTAQDLPADLRGRMEPSPELDIEIGIPRASTVRIEEVGEGTKTWVSSASTSWPAGVVTLKTLIDGIADRSGRLGPGAHCVIPNLTGEITFTRAPESPSAALKDALRRIAEGYLAEAFDQLRQLKSRGGDAYDSVAANALSHLEARTRDLRIEYFPIQDPLPLHPGTRVRLVSLDDEKAPPSLGRYGSGLRALPGEHRLEVTGPGGEILGAVPRVKIGAAGGTAALPEGWRVGIYVGGPRPFFIQHVEVTVRDYGKAVPDYKPAFEGASLPAHGISFERAGSYARAAGLRLPTREQWLRAAALRADSPYPWGSDDPAGRCGLGQAKPSRAGRPKGDRSLFGVAGLTGNVREWLRDGTVIGGSFRTPIDTPPERLFRPAKPADGATLDDVGFRCVLELDR